jgi:acyl-CoA synthetase (AMP-forming)/AMP-acid ligase II/uncharacterized protein YndB with AHSA1/START domain
MTMRVSHQITIDRTAAEVWELIGEPSLYPRYLRDVSRWESVAGGDDGHRRYRIEVRVGAVELGAVVEVTHVAAPHELRWKSISGIEHQGRWRVTENGDHRCTVALELDYHAPGGVLGTVAEAAALPLLRRGVHESLAHLKAEVEGHNRARGILARAAGFTREAVYDAEVLAQARLVAPTRPDRLVRAARELVQWDATLAAGCAIAATLHPDDRALVDERGAWTFGEVHRRTNALARGLEQAGVAAGDRVGILCRNHAGFAEGLLALSKLGADALLLNPGLAPPQLRELLRRERPAALIHDEEFTDTVKLGELVRFVAWQDEPRGSDVTLETLISATDPGDLSPPPRHGRLVLLTSGTTGAPKAAARHESDRLGVPLALLDRIPLRARQVTHIASPLFHSWGYLHFGLGIAVSATLVLRRHFDPEVTLATVARDQVDTLAVVPTMLGRILELEPAVRRRYAASSLRIVAASGSALPGELATRFMDEFGDVLYNVYGSTEASWVAIATPADLRAAPGTVGRPPHGTRVMIYDEQGRSVPTGSRGRIFAGNATSFDGYTDGRGKEIIDGLLSTGDIGHIDDAGRLFVDGREDEMIISGGENILPSEIEGVLAAHPGVAEVVAIGVDDERFGQRLKAFVVRATGAVVSEEELEQLVRAKVAPFKVPREIEFVNDLPHNEAGKVVKAGLGVRRSRA